MHYGIRTFFVSAVQFSLPGHKTAAARRPPLRLSKKVLQHEKAEQQGEE